MTALAQSIDIIGGYKPVYRHGENNHCPACSRTQFWVRRVTAECAFCSTAMPVAEMAPLFAGYCNRKVT